MPLSQKLEDKLSEIVLEIVSVNEDVFSLAQKYVDEGIIPQTYRDNALHIALATYNEADALISWNFKHMVKLKTIRGVIREKNYERMKHLSVKEQIKIIQTEAEPIKKRLLEKMKKKELPALDR